MMTFIHISYYLPTHSSFVSPFIIRIIVHSFLYSLTYLSRLGSDRSICLYDLRASVPMRKFLLPMNSNKVTYIYILMVDDHDNDDGDGHDDDDDNNDWDDDDLVIKY